MREVAIHEMRPGQVLAADVFDERGGLLLSKGMQLTGDHVELLERRGVLTVAVEVEGAGAGAPPAEPGKVELESAMDRLEHMFEGLDEDPVMRAIHAAARGMLASAQQEGASE
jgi:hypothetical protein